MHEPEPEPEQEFPTPLKSAIRWLWTAAQLLEAAQRDDDDPFIIESRKEDVRRYEALVERLRAQTSPLVLTGAGDCSYTDPLIDLGAIKMLLQRSIVYECQSCEEREDLEACYNGDHREFHLSGDHTEFCIEKALHEYDQKRWPTFFPPTESYDECKECGIVASPEKG